MEALSAAVTVDFTEVIKFWAFPTNISVASRSSSLPACEPIIVAFTVDSILSCWAIVGILSEICNKF